MSLTKMFEESINNLNCIGNNIKYVNTINIFILKLKKNVLVRNRNGNLDYC